MQRLSESQGVSLESCGVKTWDGSSARISASGWVILVVVTDFSIGLDRLCSINPEGEPVDRPDIIIWPGSMASTPDLIPLSLREVSLFDVDGDISRQFPSTEPWTVWLNTLPETRVALSCDSSPTWRRRADQTIDLGDVLH